MNSPRTSQLPEPTSLAPTLAPEPSKKREKSEDSSSEVTLKQIRDRALTQPLDHLRELRLTGAVLVSIARLRQSVSTGLVEGLRMGWDCVSASRARPLIAQALNESAAMFVNYGIFCGRREILTSKDISDWTLPVPDPKTLVLARQKAEILNRSIPISKGCAWVFSLTTGGINKAYQWIYRKEKPLYTLPNVPDSVTHLLLGNGPGDYLPFTKRADKLFMQALLLHDGLLELPESKGITSVSDLDFFKRMKTLMKQDVSRVFNNVTYNTLTKTQVKREAWIEAVDGMMLRMIYDSAANKLPSREALLREFVINQLASQILLPVDWATAAVTGHLPYPFNQMERLPDFVEYSSKMTASLASSVIVEKLLIHGETLGLQYGPMAYGLIYQEMDRWAAEGNRRIDQFTTTEGMQNLFLGEKSEGAGKDDLQEILDANRGYLVPICAEFTLGAIGRMCEDSRLGEAKGPLGLIQVGLRSILMGEVLEAASEAGSEKKEETPPKPEIAGMAEAKLAFKEMIQEMKQVFFMELKNELNAELERQKLSVKQAFSTTVQVQDSLLEWQAHIGSKATFGMISPERILNVTRDAPMAAINGVANAPGAVINGVSNLASGIRQRITGQPKQDTQQ